MTNPVVKINFVDFGSIKEYYQGYIVQILGKFSQVEISENPDYLFYSTYGSEHLQYSCIKIYWQVEELEPDFNMCDYAIGYTNIAFYDRHLYLPLFASPSGTFRIKRSFEKHKQANDFYLLRRKFCNFIYSNGKGDKFRENAFHALNGYKRVDSAGRFLNNMGNTDIAGSRANEDYEETKIEFLKDYRFTIAMSNAQKFGYLDEKMFDAWIAGSIPIYWGDPKANEYFNPEAFIDCTRCKTAQEVLEKVREIDEDDDKYLAMQKAPITRNREELEKFLDENRIIEFLKHILLQDILEAKRVSGGIWSQEYHKKLLIVDNIEKTFLCRTYKKISYSLKRRGFIK